MNHSTSINRYYHFRLGQTVMANVSKVHDGILIDKGTRFTMSAFPLKPRGYHYLDYNPKGYQYKRFVTGYTEQRHLIALLMSEICMPPPG